MSGQGYTYTTLSGGPEEPVRVGVSFHLDDRAWICVAGAENGRPHLVIAHGDVSVSVGLAPDQVTAEDARIARHLADQAAEYAAEVERLSAATSMAPEAGTDGTEAAGDPAA
jgi:hypothetical protein